MKSPISSLRIVGLIEGVSFLVLLFIAMPMKYLAEIDMAVKVAGWAHGILFMALGGLLLMTWLSARWSVARSALVLGAALVPFGPFLIDRRLKRYQAEHEAQMATA